MRYLESRYEAERDDLLYREYITDSFKVIGRLDRRFMEILADTKRTEPPANPDEIVIRIKANLRKVRES